MAKATTSKIHVQVIELLEESTQYFSKMIVPVANVLEGPLVQWIAPVLHLGLSVSSFDYHPQDVSQ